eukprot:CAMPEP_0177559380 /NCGR_PEP_ID=MMETSP0369-20130122/70802_1 /TAXON_ID=447022 ORGANISM="Scrippsiella hangoei-like, Strain SHHI-4" /NCGR_SAMPLE_ID=MMETSP0369 /ASSEMBLY_ACC=CAM_ASM_000364 /LENGTH=82 /DNA_ID=CAMNT_0019046099 /DNA_START=7 /DNA_END=255 /DNA_ORIENTATION=-
MSHKSTRTTDCAGSRKSQRSIGIAEVGYLTRSAFALACVFGDWQLVSGAWFRRNSSVQCCDEDAGGSIGVTCVASSISAVCE